MKTETITLGQYELTMTALPARVGVRVAARLTNALAPGVGSLPEDGNPTVKDIAEALARVAGDPALGDLIDYLIATFGERTQVRNVDTGQTQPLMRAFDVIFSDAYDDMLTWLAASLQLSLSSFLRRARELVAQALAAQSVSKSPNSAAKTGSVGEQS